MECQEPIESPTRIKKRRSSKDESPQWTRPKRTLTNKLALMLGKTSIKDLDTSALQNIFDILRDGPYSEVHGMDSPTVAYIRLCMTGDKFFVAKIRASFVHFRFVVGGNSLKVVKKPKANPPIEKGGKASRRTINRQFVDRPFRFHCYKKSKFGRMFQSVALDLSTSIALHTIEFLIDASTLRSHSGLKILLPILLHGAIHTCPPSIKIFRIVVRSRMPEHAEEVEKLLPDIWQILTTMLPKCSNLQVLDVHINSRISSQSSSFDSVLAGQRKGLPPSVKKHFWPNLSSLQLRSSRIRTQHIMSVLDQVPNMQNIVTLCMSNKCSVRLGNNILPSIAPQLLHLIFPTRNYSTNHLRNCNFTHLVSLQVVYLDYDYYLYHLPRTLEYLAVKYLKIPMEQVISKRLDNHLRDSWVMDLTKHATPSFPSNLTEIQFFEMHTLMYRDSGNLLKASISVALPPSLLTFTCESRYDQSFDSVHESNRTDDIGTALKWKIAQSTIYAIRDVGSIRQWLYGDIAWISHVNLHDPSLQQFFCSGMVTLNLNLVGHYGTTNRNGLDFTCLSNLQNLHVNIWIYEMAPGQTSMDLNKMLPVSIRHASINLSFTLSNHSALNGFCMDAQRLPKLTTFFIKTNQWGRESPLYFEPPYSTAHHPLQFAVFWTSSKCRRFLLEDGRDTGKAGHEGCYLYVEPLRGPPQNMVAPNQMRLERLADSFRSQFFQTQADQLYVMTWHKTVAKIEGHLSAHRMTHNGF